MEGKKAVKERRAQIMEERTKEMMSLSHLSDERCKTSSGQLKFLGDKEYGQEMTQKKER